MGNPFGLSFKQYVGSTQAFDINFAFLYGPGLRFGFDWLWTQARGRHRTVDLEVYMGAGPFVGAFESPCSPWFLTDRCSGGVYAGARAPFGVELLLKPAPLALGLEVAPALALAPEPHFLLDFLFAIRFLL